MYDDMQPDNTNPTPIGAHEGSVDREGAMAKADLHKLANYSIKLFKKIKDEDQLEGWVQAKITKAADYIASVYHYLEYEMEFSEYGAKLDNSEMYNEDQKLALKNKLMEAKSKIAELKKSQAEKMKVKEGTLSGGDRPCTECGGSGMVYEEPKAVPAHVKSKVEKYKRLTKATHAASKRLDRNNNGIPDNMEGEKEVDEEFGSSDKEMKVGDTKKTRTGELTKTSTGVIHKNTSYKDDGDEIASNAKSGKGIKSHAKAQSAAEKKDKAPAQKMSPKSAKTWGMKDSEKFDNRDGAPAKPKKEKDVDETYGQGVYEGNEPKDKPKKGEKVGKEGNAFGKAVRDAKADGIQKGEKVKVGGKEYPVKEAADEKCNHTAKGKKCPVHGLKECSMEESTKQTMSRAAKGHEKYGKAGMAALAKAGKEGKSLEPIKAKYNKYDESTAWKNKANAMKESLDAMSEASDQGDAMVDALIKRASESDPQGLQSAMQQGPEALTSFLKQFMQEIENKFDSGEKPQDVASTEPKDMAGMGDSETAENIGVVPNPSGATSVDQAKKLGGSMPAPAGEPDPIGMNESADLNRMKQFLTRLNG
jgi:hypothetical protein